VKYCSPQVEAGANVVVIAMVALPPLLATLDEVAEVVLAATEVDMVESYRERKEWSIRTSAKDSPDVRRMCNQGVLEPHKRLSRLVWE
jgi:hypothetical protein